VAYLCIFSAQAVATLLAYVAPAISIQYFNYAIGRWARLGVGGSCQCHRGLPVVDLIGVIAHPSPAPRPLFPGDTHLSSSCAWPLELDNRLERPELATRKRNNDDCKVQVCKRARAAQQHACAQHAIASRATRQKWDLERR
jgi:hypothetical protein